MSRNTNRQIAQKLRNLDGSIGGSPREHVDTHRKPGSLSPKNVVNARLPKYSTFLFQPAFESDKLESHSAQTLQLLVRDGALWPSHVYPECCSFGRIASCGK